MARAYQAFILILALIIFSGCARYIELWEVERVPLRWEEEIVFKADHWHYVDCCDSTWRCSYVPADTFCWVHYDTLVIRNYVGITKIKRDGRK